MNDFDDSPRTDPDAAAEALVIDGPADEELECTPPPFTDADQTPVAKRLCRECGGHLEIIEGWRPPVDAAAAWTEWHMACVWSPSQDWSFCPATAIAWIADVRRDFERRKRRPAHAAWDGNERRRRKLAPLRQPT